ncbi:MAG TPA: hypothetical protein VHX17_09215 [Candidatus Cybelea sp.]|jgi:hypothetical protein|nr:hypothetical protein [Candidatus Cybelea sp.]
MKAALLAAALAVSLVAAVLLAGKVRAPAADSRPSQVTSPSAYGAVVWRAGDPVLGKWQTANTQQCGKPVATGASFFFNLKQDGTNCGRNQMLPLTPSGSLFQLTPGHVYTWVFDYIDGDANGKPPGMGNDGGVAQSVVWQIHGYNEPGTPCTQLGFGNTPPNSAAGQPQRWLIDDCGSSLSAPFWTGPYAPQETDRFVIEAKVSAGSTGWTKLYRNGALVASSTGANYHSSPNNPWWNFGIYKWRWQLANAGGSKMTEVQNTVNNMTLYDRAP